MAKAAKIAGRIDVVMAGLVPAIHVFLVGARRKAWMPGTRPGMTSQRL